MQDEHICPDCGDPMADEFDDLLLRLANQADGHDGAVVVRVLAYMLGSIIAQQVVEERPKVRHEVSMLLAEATRLHERANRDALH